MLLSELVQKLCVYPALPGLLQSVSGWANSSKQVLILVAVHFTATWKQHFTSKCKQTSLFPARSQIRV